MIAAVILAALCAVLGLRLYALEKDIRSCARQLREDEGARVRMAAPNRAAEDLLSAVNRLLELREADEAEHRRQEHAIRQQISNISHDLRTPLTSILGYLQLLEGDSLTVEERREYLGIVRGRAKALQSLITSFYDLSRLRRFVLARLESCFEDFRQIKLRRKVLVLKGIEIPHQRRELILVFQLYELLFAVV